MFKQLSKQEVSDQEKNKRATKRIVFARKIKCKNCTTEVGLYFAKQQQHT